MLLDCLGQELWGGEGRQRENDANIELVSEIDYKLFRTATLLAYASARRKRKTVTE